MNHAQCHKPEEWRAILARGQSCSAVSIRSAHAFYDAEDYCNTHAMRNAVTLPRQRCVSSFSPLDLIVLATTTAPRPHEIAPPQSLLSQPPPQVVTTATPRDTE